MEILPGVGVLGLRLGADRAAVESLLGKPSATHLGVAVYDDRDPALVLRYAEDGSLEMIEIPYSGCGNEVTLGPVQLAYRLLDDVIEDLRQAGFIGRKFDIGYDFVEGFAVWSMSSIEPAAIDPSASPDDERLVVEGVSVVAPDYFA